MLLQKLNGVMRKRSWDRYRKNSRGTGNVSITDAQTGFIHHRSGFPLDYRRLLPDADDEQPRDDKGSIGLLFHSGEYLKPGTAIEATITLNNRPEKIRGKVVMVRDRDDYYEIGLWLSHHEDASRARIVEQACCIEEYIKEKKFREGPFILNREVAAEEWISKYAAGVPGR